MNMVRLNDVQIEAALTHKVWLHRDRARARDGRDRVPDVRRFSTSGQAIFLPYCG
jgi:hypothetical protein